MPRFAQIFVLFFFSWMQCISQDSLFILHPILGEVIDKNEKKDYLLFPEIADSIFNYGYIQHAGNKYCLNSYLLSDSLLSRIIDTAEIQQYKINVE